jgi:hypothetical protein
MLIKVKELFDIFLRTIVNSQINGLLKYGRYCTVNLLPSQTGTGLGKCNRLPKCFRTRGIKAANLGSRSEASAGTAARTCCWPPLLLLLGHSELHPAADGTGHSELLSARRLGNHPHILPEICAKIVWQNWLEGSINLVHVPLTLGMPTFIWNHYGKYNNSILIRDV